MFSDFKQKLRKNKDVGNRPNKSTHQRGDGAFRTLLQGHDALRQPYARFCDSLLAPRQGQTDAPDARISIEQGGGRRYGFHDGGGVAHRTPAHCNPRARRRGGRKFLQEGILLNICAMEGKDGGAHRRLPPRQRSPAQSRHRADWHSAHCFTSRQGDVGGRTRTVGKG